MQLDSGSFVGRTLATDARCLRGNREIAQPRDELMGGVFDGLLYPQDVGDPPYLQNEPGSKQAECCDRYAIRLAYGPAKALDGQVRSDLGGR